MCGILGVYDPNRISINSFKKMLDTLNHRGPDNTGIWQNKFNGLLMGHKRLSIQDLSQNGNQPMISQSRRYVIVFNGEIYNHFQIRNKLKIYNINWKSNSDTETILETYERLGLLETLTLLNGMFSFSIYDIKENNLVLCRDRFGEKPLYYGLKDNIIFFSSELKILKNSNFKKTLNKNALNLYLKYGYIPSPYSIYNEIEKVEPGQVIEINLNNYKINKTKYYNFIEKITNIKPDLSINKKNVISKFENKMIDVIKSQTISDVGYGVFLSSGIDSTLIASLLSQNSNEKIDTFTIKVEDQEYNESNEAEEISKILGTNFNVREISHKNLLDKIYILSDVYDEPFADSSQIPTLLLCENAVKIKKVFLSGDGGDEILGGYNRHTQINRFFKLNFMIKIMIKYFLYLLNNHGFYKLYNNLSHYLPISIRSSLPETHIKKILHILNSNTLDEAYHKIISIWPEKYNIDTYDLSINNNQNIKNNDKFIFNDTLNYLPNDIFCKVDRASMYYSLETRAPYVDINFINFYHSIPLEVREQYLSKNISKKILEKFLPNKLIYQPKKGFGIPVKKWLNTTLKNFLHDNLSNQINNLNEMFGYKLLDINKLSNIKNNEDAYKIWSLLVFQLWIKKNI